MKACKYILVFLLAGISTQAAQYKPVDQPAICYECHDDVSSYMEKKNVHAPFNGGTCSECHNPHASKHASLLGDDVKNLCLSCHDTIKEEIGKTSPHLPAATGDCIHCHNPHASDAASLLSNSTPELCIECHSQVTDWMAKSNVHAPVDGGDCAACHGAHGENNAALLKAKAPVVCYDCHTDNSRIKSAHKGYDISEANCITCHDPHASSVASLLRPNQHKPFEAGNCGSCHEDKAENSFAVKSDPKTLCLKCHKSSIDLELTFKHNLHDDKSCLNCHNPHTSAADFLLASEQKDLCMGCHFNNMEKEKNAYITHDGMDCSNCHMPHTSNDEQYLKNDKINLCIECHTESHQASHPLGNDIIDPRTEQPVVCSSCHQMHGADFDKYIPLNPSMDLCIQCHKR